MKTLLLMRHAKSSWKDHHVKDRDRQLTKRGIRNAVEVGELIKEEELVPQMVLSSSVARASDTAELVLKACGYTGEVLFLDSLFMAEADVIRDALKLLPDSLERVLVIGHNPGLESLLQILSGEVLSLPTAGLACLSLPVSTWTEIGKDASAQYVQIWKPKELEKPEKGESVEPVQEASLPGKNEKPVKKEKPEKPGKMVKAEKVDHTDKAEKAEKPEKGSKKK